VVADHVRLHWFLYLLVIFIFTFGVVAGALSVSLLGESQSQELMAAVPELAVALAHKKAVAVAYETIQQADGSLPLLEPMSEITGKMSIQER